MKPKSRMLQIGIMFPRDRFRNWTDHNRPADQTIYLSYYDEDLQRVLTEEEKKRATIRKKRRR